MSEITEQKFMVIDFETVTPKGVPPEPIQLGMVQIDNFEVSNIKQKSWYIKPPEFAPLTIFDTKQTGITSENLTNAKNSADIFNIVESICEKNQYIFIAQNANYEYNICKRFYDGRNNLKKIKFIDTIKLAKLQFPNLKSYKLDALAKEYDIQIPKGRHTALIDCIITGKLFIELVKSLKIQSVEELIYKGCINNDKLTQLTLF